MQKYIIACEVSEINSYFFFFSKKSPIFVNFIIYFIANPLYILYN